MAVHAELAGTHCAAGKPWQLARSAQGNVHTPHMHVSRLPQLFALGSQRLKKWVSPPVGSVLTDLQPNATASTTSRIESRLLATLGMIFVVTVFVYQTLPRVDHDAGVCFWDRGVRVERCHTLSEVT